MKILQLNLNHCETAHDLLMQTVRQLQLDLVLIAEPYRHLNNQPWESDSTTKAVIWSCGKFPFQSVVSNNSNGFVAASVNGIRFYSCYAPPSLPIADFTEFLDRLTEDAKQYYPVAIAGDFNSWAVDWGSKQTNARGKALLEAMATLDVVLLNIGETPTYTKGEASSIIDLTFVSSSLLRGSYSWTVMNTYTASDHNAILWEISAGRNPRRATRQTNAVGWKVKDFDSEALVVALDKDSTITGDAEEKTKNLMTKITQACDTCMPRKRGINQRPSVHWWNDQISALRTACLKKRRTSQRGYRRPNSVELVAEYKKARRELNKAIKDSKKRCWKELVEEVERDPWGRPYKVVMTHLKYQPIPSPTCPQLLERIVSTLFPRQREFIYSSLQINSEDIPPVTEEELMEACNRVGNNKAPGLDGIPNIALKTSIKAAPKLFLETYDSCLKEGIFPRRWKQQRLVLLPKGKKPPDEPSSYRPLCMLDTAGKILERIIHQRIDAVVDPLLSENQYGFRKGRSTLDAIDLVVNTAKEAIAGKRWRRGTKKYCLVAALDIKNAFNSANWDCIMRALEEKQVPGYLCRMVASYFTSRVLRYDTQSGPKEYNITGGVPQGSVLGPLLWNVMYDGLLKIAVPKEVKLVAYADDVAVVIVAKHLEEINLAFDITFSRINRWMDMMNLELAKHKTEAVLITSRKIVENIKLNVGEHEITSQPFIRYLGVMLDARLNFKQQVEHVSAKASAVVTSLSRLMPNVGGPKQSRRLLLTSVVTSVLTYGISVWADALETQESWRKAGPVYRLSALRVASAFRTISEEAVCVISGTLPLRVLAEERRNLYHRKRSSTLSAEDLRTEERRYSIARWQQLWDAAEKGRWTYRLIPRIDVWLGRNHGEVNYYLTQMLSGHGCFRAYLHRFKHDDSPECPACPRVAENAEHVFFECPRFIPQRDELEKILNKRITPESIVEEMLPTEAAWNATCTFATEVLTELRSIEGRRTENKI
ncbi:uncharacterized protein LOC107216897 [Neodiprion lecontei]|uniref:Uncharacterized protein LOC107216897 n=1 Tax=Neodiprion lecontei TaxID=441921 RepID=A0A6J0B3P8_NEOLC|nr:uncharacterized protein LOC107216897 [Neodiprion lecontei]